MKIIHTLSFGQEAFCLKPSIRIFFTDELILFFESNKQYHIEASENGLLIIGNERFSSVKEMKALAYFGIGLQKII